jgi:hypothetical protein
VVEEIQIRTHLRAQPSSGKGWSGSPLKPTARPSRTSVTVAHVSGQLCVQVPFTTGVPELTSCICQWHAAHALTLSRPAALIAAASKHLHATRNGSPGTLG